MKSSYPAIHRALVTLVTVFVVFGLAVPASAHITVSTANPTAGGFAVYTVRVPNERDDASTTTVEVQIPDGLEASRYQPLEGWDISLDEGVLTISGGSIGPGQYQEFSFQARNPEDPSVLRFAAVQTYDSGEVVEWTGEEGSETPASTVEVTAAGPGEGGHGAAGGHGGDAATEATDGATPAAEPDGAATADQGGVNASPTLAVIALIASLVAAVLGGLALARTRR